MFRYSNIALEREIIHFIQALNQFVEMLLVKSTYFKLTLSGKKYKLNLNGGIQIHLSKNEVFKSKDFKPKKDLHEKEDFKISERLVFFSMTPFFNFYS